jgi:hypothetical protein
MWAARVVVAERRSSTDGRQAIQRLRSSAVDNRGAHFALRGMRERANLIGISLAADPPAERHYCRKRVAR